MLLSFPCTLFCTRPSQAKKMRYFPRGIQQVNFIQHFAFQSCKSNEKMTRKVNREMFPFQTPSSGLIHPTVNAICQIHVRCSYCRTTNWIKLFDLSLQRRRAQAFARKDNNLSIFFLALKAHTIWYSDTISEWHDSTSSCLLLFSIVKYRPTTAYV